MRAVIDESYERIHRSNLIGMGVLPLQYAEGEIADSIGLTGEEEVAIAGVEAINDGTTPREVTESPGTSSSRPDRGPTRPWKDYFGHGRIMQYVLEACSTDCSRQERDALSMTVVEIQPRGAQVDDADA